MNDAPELYAIVKEWEKELKRKKRKQQNKRISDDTGHQPTNLG